MSVTGWKAMDSTRRIALVTGIFFIATFVTSIVGLILYGPVLNDADYIIGAGADMRVSLGALLEVFLVVANIGTAVTLFPILKRQNEGLALGYVYIWRKGILDWGPKVRRRPVSAMRGLDDGSRTAA